ncbi:T6SS immunity protein Tli3 family protein, partial [Burkholderia ubonensis]
MNRYLLWVVSALSLGLLTACSLLIPPGIPSGMTNPAARGTPISNYPERLVYRIDDHRYITIQGNRNCVGMIWY